MLPTVLKINPSEDLELPFQIRKEVFIVEQKVSAREEFDEYDKISFHFLAFHEKKPVGTARYRKTESGFKLERFSVLKDFRNKGIGTALMNAMIEDITASNKRSGNNFLYLHAQTSAIDFYKMFDFIPKEPVFQEAGIDHILMIKTV